MPELFGLNIDDSTYNRICAAYNILDPLGSVDKFFLRCPNIICQAIMFPAKLKKKFKNFIKWAIGWEKIKASKAVLQNQ